MTGFIVNRPLQPGDRLQSRDEMLENALRGPVSDETFARAEAHMLGRPYMAEEEVERAHDRAASEGPPRPKAAPCSMGVGCDEAGVCYAAAHGRPEMCPREEIEDE